MMTEEMREKQRKYRKKIDNASTHKYEKTPSGFLMRLYRNMQSRIMGVQWRKAHLYAGKKLLSRQKFYKWARPHKDFWKLYKVWIANNYNRKLTPTVDRVDSSEGYILSNMRWLTHSENSRRHK